MIAGMGVSGMIGAWLVSLLLGLAIVGVCELLQRRDARRRRRQR